MHHNKSVSGYGLALLMVFLASSVLLATSMSLILTPGVTSFLSSGSSGMDVSRGKQIALAALNAAKSDIISQMQNGTTITTSYRYPSSGSNSITIPSYPSSGSTNTIGSYYVTVNKVRGFTYILTATATVNNTVINLSQLMQMNASNCPIAGTTAIYSLRKLSCNYTGNVVKVRCASHPTAPSTQDIGFSGGSIDIAALKLCLGDTILPLDVDTSAKVAYGLRKLRSAYTGYAFRVQRDSDNAWQDIGFDSNGNIDIVALQNFVGTTATGYVTIWYDQTGNSPAHNLISTGSGTAQPAIVRQGNLQTHLHNNTPALHFSYTAYLYNSAVTGFISGTDVTSFIVARVDPGSPGTGRLAVLHKTGDSSDYNTSTSMQLLSQVNNSTVYLNNYSNNEGAATGSPNSIANIIFEATTIKQGGSAISLAINNGSFFGGNVNSGGGDSRNSIAPDYLVVGAGRGGSTINNAFMGYISELIVYNKVVAVADRQSIERSEVHYFSIPPKQDGFITTWYDQSGNGLNLTQATTGLQPSIDIGGVRPGIYFDGVDDYLGNTAASVTTDKMTAFGVAKMDNYNTPGNGRLLSIGKTGDGNDWGSSTSSQVIGKGNNTVTNSRTSDLSPSTGIDLLKAFQATALINGTTRYIRDNQAGSTNINSTTTGGSGNLVINNLRVGWAFNGGGNADYFKGKVQEVILFPKAYTTTQCTSFETNEINYYNIK